MSLFVDDNDDYGINNNSR